MNWISYFLFKLGSMILEWFKVWAITMYTPLYGWTNPRQQRGGGEACLIKGGLRNMG